MKSPAAAFGLAILTLAFVACAGPDITPTSPASLVPEAAGANALVPQFNLDVTLLGGQAFGHLAFRQNHDGAQLAHLGVTVQHLAPNTSYVLQRAVDAMDGVCTSAAWLTLGKGATPQTIDTNAAGTGQADLWRSLTAVPVGTTFDITFRVLDATTQAVVLTSDCYQFFVR
jgi:hypothetical protein